jgi:hypothetical protein
MVIQIRRATVDDARELALLLQEIGWFDALNKGNLNNIVSRVRARLHQCLADNSYSTFIAEWPTGEIAGYGSVHWLPYLFYVGARRLRL